MKNICRFFLIVCLCLSLVSCSFIDRFHKKDKNGENAIFYADLSSDPDNLDPQTATNKNAITVIENIFCGLTRIDKDGNLIPGVAERYEVTKGGYEYIFYLRKDAFWNIKIEDVVNTSSSNNNSSDLKNSNENVLENDSEISDTKTDLEPEEVKYLPVTSADFVFAFQRLFRTETKSLNSERFFSIVNSKEIRSGETDIKHLGVFAEDDYTLIIRLEEINDDFPYLLATSPAMPCNKEFFDSCEGRYGRSEECITGNGPFNLTTWSYNYYSTEGNMIRLKRSDTFFEKVSPDSVKMFIIDNLKIDNVNDKMTEFFNKEESDYIVETGEKARVLQEKGFPYIEFQNTSIGIIFNQKGKFSSISSRQALSASIDKELLETLPKKFGYEIARRIIPPVLTSDKEETFSFPPLSKGSKLDVYTAEFLVPEDDIFIEYAGYITQKWQEDYSFFCNIKVLPENKLNTALLSGDYDFAIVKINGGYYSGHSYTQKVLELGGITGVLNEEKLISSAAFIPLVFETMYFIYQKGCEDIVFNPFSQSVIFQNAKKK